MTPSVTALILIFGIIALGSALGFYAGARYRMDLEQWAIACRGFGLGLVWLLTAGEVYTTFSFLGASGWAYSKGGPTLYILAYMTLAYVVSFFILPAIWEVGQTHALCTESDFFEKRYDSKLVAALVSLVGIIFMIPYVQLQLTGLGIIVEVASFEGVSRNVAMIVSVLLIAGFVLISGVRAVAWVSVLKDGLMVLAALVVGIGVPLVHFGSIGSMFATLVRLKPAHLLMPGSTKDMGHSWYISTVLLTSFGFYMWPHMFAATFTAKSEDVLRRNAVFMPLYTLMLPLLLSVGFAAILIVPGLNNGDLALLSVVRKTFHPWILGLIGGAGALTAMVPAATLILTAAMLFSKNLYRAVLAPGTSDYQVTRLAKVAVLVIAGTALYFAIYRSTSLVALLLLGYGGVTQFFPGVLFGLYWKRVTATGVLAGMLTGLSTVVFLVLTNRDPFWGLNAGFVALCSNFAVTALLSQLSPPQHNRFEEYVQGVTR